MKNILKILLITLLVPTSGFGQIMQGNGTNETSGNSQKGLTWGAYGETKYRQQLSDDKSYNAKLDVHRVVLLMGYNFSSRLKMVAEIEVEHVKEIYLEQAFATYRFNDYFNLKGGLVLIPVGIINELHEPTSFYGVNRPLIDRYIIPSTWREIGLGFTGNVRGSGISYQAYVVNGFKSFDEKGLLTASSGLRKGRQKGAESFMSSPNFTAKVNYMGIPGLNIGLSTYLGKMESSMLDGLDLDDVAAQNAADSTVVGISMFAAELEYLFKGLRLRGQYVVANLDNLGQYNAFTGQNIGSSIYGFYGEIGYDVMHLFKDVEDMLIPFFRYENYDTQSEMHENIPVSGAYDIHQYTMGINYRITPEFVVKADYQMNKSEADDSFKKYVNLGIGFWF